MAPPQDRSCYVLELSVGPGGSRWAELHTYTSLDHLRACLDVFLENGGGTSAYHAIYYGATLGVWTVQGGDVVGFVDLHPFIQVRHLDKPPVALTDEAGTSALVYARRKELYEKDREGADAEDEEDEIPGPNEWDDSDLITYEEMTMAVDWSGVLARLPALEPPLLAPGERAKVRYDRWTKSPRAMYASNKSVRFGSHDVEGGEKLDPPFEIEMPASDDEDEDEDDEFDD
ncbi:hypothetical protein [Polyangium sp. y55x31]|uniref:hypothetical protein n=1 Tax=Polyangium sp. y55x31 TaxID=3042688 RepID=UPI002482C49E|nr:hypothetical protein [Polyangium sp. y55x31]MDI1478183.1 hypothetical protein [Polyangium sp. y55x31]